MPAVYDNYICLRILMLFLFMPETEHQPYSPSCYRLTFSPPPLYNGHLVEFTINKGNRNTHSVITIHFTSSKTKCFPVEVMVRWCHISLYCCQVTWPVFWSRKISLPLISHQEMSPRGNFAASNFASRNPAARKFRFVVISLWGIFAAWKICRVEFLHSGNFALQKNSPRENFIAFSPRWYFAHLHSCRESNNFDCIQIIQIHKEIGKLSVLSQY